MAIKYTYDDILEILDYQQKQGKPCYLVLLMNTPKNQNQQWIYESQMVNCHRLINKFNQKQSLKSKPLNKRQLKQKSKIEEKQQQNQQQQQEKQQNNLKKKQNQQILADTDSDSNDSEEIEQSAIVNQRLVIGNQLQQNQIIEYRVRWDGKFDKPQFDSWLQETDLDRKFKKNLIKNYHQNQKNFKNQNHEKITFIDDVTNAKPDKIIKKRIYNNNINIEEYLIKFKGYKHKNYDKNVWADKKDIENNFRISKLLTEFENKLKKNSNNNSQLLLKNQNYNENDYDQDNDSQDFEIDLRNDDFFNNDSPKNKNKKNQKQKNIKQENIEPEEYIPDKIVDHQIYFGQFYYKTHWKNYGSEDDTIEAVENLENFKHLIIQYQKINKEKLEQEFEKYKQIRQQQYDQKYQEYQNKLEKPTKNKKISKTQHNKIEKIHEISSDTQTEIKIDEEKENKKENKIQKQQIKPSKQLVKKQQKIPKIQDSFEIEEEEVEKEVNLQSEEKVDEEKKNEGSVQIKENIINLDQYNQEEIVSICGKRNLVDNTQYCICLKDLNKQERIWVNKEQLINCEQLIDAFENSKTKGVFFGKPNKMQKKTTPIKKVQFLEDIQQNQQDSDSTNDNGTLIIKRGRKRILKLEEQKNNIQEKQKQQRQKTKKQQKKQKTYEVEKIIDKKQEDDEIFYHVKWKGYPSSENTWEPYSSLQQYCQDLIKKFEKSNYTSPQKIETIEITDTPKKQALRPRNNKKIKEGESSEGESSEEESDNEDQIKETKYSKNEYHYSEVINADVFINKKNIPEIQYKIKMIDNQGKELFDWFSEALARKQCNAFVLCFENKNKQIMKEIKEQLKKKKQEQKQQLQNNLLENNSNLQNNFFQPNQNLLEQFLSNYSNLPNQRLGNYSQNDQIDYIKKKINDKLFEVRWVQNFEENRYICDSIVEKQVIESNQIDVITKYYENILSDFYYFSENKKLHKQVEQILINKQYNNDNKENEDSQEQQQINFNLNQQNLLQPYTKIENNQNLQQFNFFNNQNLQDIQNFQIEQSNINNQQNIVSNTEEEIDKNIQQQIKKDQNDSIEQEIIKEKQTDQTDRYNSCDDIQIIKSNLSQDIQEQNNSEINKNQESSQLEILKNFNQQEQDQQREEQSNKNSNNNDKDRENSDINNNDDNSNKNDDISDKNVNNSNKNDDHDGRINDDNYNNSNSQQEEEKIDLPQFNPEFDKNQGQQENFLDLEQNNINSNNIDYENIQQHEESAKNTPTFLQVQLQNQNNDFQFEGDKLNNKDFNFIEEENQN